MANLVCTNGDEYKDKTNHAKIRGSRHGKIDDCTNKMDYKKCIVCRFHDESSGNDFESNTMQDGTKVEEK